LFGDDQCLSDAVRLRLHGVLDGDAPLVPRAEEVAEGALISWRGDYQELANARQHQRGERIVDHRFIVNRQQLFTLRERDWM